MTVTRAKTAVTRAKTTVQRAAPSSVLQTPLIQLQRFVDQGVTLIAGEWAGIRRLDL